MKNGAINLKKFLALIISIFIFCQNGVLASSLYLINNPSKSTVAEIIENAFASKSYTLSKINPYYGISRKNSNKFAIVLLQEDITGLYYYFDGDTAVNNTILKGLKKKNFQYDEINTKLKDSFDNMAAEQVFGKKTEYVFNNQPSVAEHEVYEDRTNHIPAQENTESDFYPSNLPKSLYTTDDFQQNPVIYGYIGKLAAGTEIYAYLKDALNTENVKKGDVITLVVSRDLLYNGSVVAPQGSLINGKVVKSNSAGYAHRNGKISINFDTLTLPSGKVYNISTEKVDFKVESDEKQSSSVAVKMAVGAATTALMGLMFAALGSSNHVGSAMAIGAGVGAAGVGIAEAAKKGVDAEIPAYTEINLVLTKALNITKN